MGLKLPPALSWVKVAFRACPVVRESRLGLVVELGSPPRETAKLARTVLTGRARCWSAGSHASMDRASAIAGPALARQGRRLDRRGAGIEQQISPAGLHGGLGYGPLLWTLECADLARAWLELGSSWRSICLSGLPRGQSDAQGPDISPELDTLGQHWLAI